jgi:hypothetical protein
MILAQFAEFVSASFDRTRNAARAATASAAPALGRVVTFGSRPATPAHARDAAAAPRSRPHANPPIRGIDAQWSAVVRRVDAAIATTQAVADAHRAAIEKIDAADYALNRLFEELRDVMPNLAETSRMPVMIAFPVAARSGAGAHQIAA